MSNYEVRYEGDPATARKIVFDFVRSLTGDGVRFIEESRWVKYAVMIAALTDVKLDYVRKSAHLRGEDGVLWPELSPATIARRRIGRGDHQASASVRDRVRVYRRHYRRYLQRYLLSLPEDQAKPLARRAAEQATSRETKKTKVDALGSREVEILRDTGVLLASVSPGELTGSPAAPTYNVPSIEGGEFQDVNPTPAGIVMSTNVIYAEKHQKGGHSASGAVVPPRPFIPERPPPVWQERWAAVAGDAAAVALRIIFETESGR